MVGEHDNPYLYDNPYLKRMPADAAAATYCANRGDIEPLIDEIVAMPKITSFSPFLEVLGGGQVISGFVISSETPDRATHYAIEATPWSLSPQAKKIATYAAGITLPGLSRHTTSGGQI